jgi:hypothetical protein
MPNAVTSGKWSPNELRAMSVAVSLSSSLVFFPGCAARTAQQVIDSLKEQSIAMQGAVEFTRLERLKLNSKCRGAHDTFGRLISPPLEEEFRRSGPKFFDPRLQAVLDYVKHAYVIQRYMGEGKATAEASLALLGDLLLPPVLPPEVDPLNGCLLSLGPPPDTPRAYGGGKLADDYVFYWQSRDWREAERVSLKVFDRHLPPESRTPFVRFIFEYSLELTRTPNDRAEKGEFTLLQGIRAYNAGGQFLLEQAKRHGAQLKENLDRAKAQDDTLLATVAVGLGAVATAALAVNTYENYRIANAQTATARAVQLQSAQAQVPIRCSYNLPGRYGSQGYILCH